MTPNSPSERERLFQSVKKAKLIASLNKNLSNLTRTQSRLRLSDSRSLSSSSLTSPRRAYSTYQNNSPKTSKNKMLAEIADKLKTCRLHHSEVKQARGWKPEETSKPAEQVKPAKKTGKGNKLSDLINNVKMSNQMSTKAVYSVSKNVKQMLAPPKKQTEETPNPRMAHVFNELISLRSEMHALKQENHLLKSMMESREILRQSRAVEETKCPHCGGQLDLQLPQFRNTAL